MFKSIQQSGNIFKAIFLIVSTLLIIFCFFMDVTKYNISDYHYYLTFSGKAHVKSGNTDAYVSLPNCSQQGLVSSLCYTVKWTPVLGGFIIGFAALTLTLQLAQEPLSRKIKKSIIWILQLVFIGIATILTVLLPILYFTVEKSLYSLCILPIIFEFCSVGFFCVSFFLYYSQNQTKSGGLLG